MKKKTTIRAKLLGQLFKDEIKFLGRRHSCIDLHISVRSLLFSEIEQIDYFIAKLFNKLLFL